MNNSRWYENDGRYLEVVLSSKAVMTRNLKGYKFPERMSIDEKDEVAKKVRDALADQGLTQLSLDGIGNSEFDDLIDSQIISSEGLFDDPEGKVILTDDDRSLAVILNNGDHIRIKAQASGYTNRVYRECEKIAVEIEKKLDVAFSNKYGYLGSSLYSTGMGFKYMFTIAIPGIVRTGDGLDVLTGKVKAHDWNIYPFLKGDKSIRGDVYIVASNPVLGSDEASVLAAGEKLISDIVKIEQLCRDNLRKNRPDILENSFYRSYGILYYSKGLDPLEALDLISWIRLYHGQEDKSEIDISWPQINTITSQLLWQVFPKNIKGDYQADVRFTAARIAKILKTK